MTSILRKPAQGGQTNSLILSTARGALQTRVRSQCNSTAYAATVRSIGASNHVLTKDDETVLRRFCSPQWCRTEAAAQHFVAVISDLAQSISKNGQVDVAMTLKEAAVSGVMNFFSRMDEIGGLKVCLASNKTPLDFVTSDNPAILTNRWYIQTPDAQGVSFGIGSAGAVFYLPLTPRVCCVIYDGAVYSVTNSCGWRDVKRVGDVEAINEQ